MQSDMSELLLELDELKKRESHYGYLEAFTSSVGFTRYIEQDYFEKKRNSCTEQLHMYPQDSAEYKALMRELDAISYLQAHFKQLKFESLDVAERIQDVQEHLR